MQRRLKVYGGFEGWASGSGAQESDVAQRDPVAHETILTGQLPEPVNCPDPNCFVPGGCNCQDCLDLVCNQAGLAQCCLVEWDDGCADAAGEWCPFLYNSYHVVAAPNLDDQQSAQLDGFTVTGGRADGNGGTFQDNFETFGGGVLITGPLNIQAEQSRPVIARCTLTDNEGDEGGGVHVTGLSDPSFLACAFVANDAREGAGIHLEADPPAQLGDLPEATLVNCLFAENTVSEHGAAIDSGGPELEVINCTLTGNSAPPAGGGNGGGGVWIELASQVTIRNSILWANSPDQIHVSSGTAVVTHSDVDGGWPCPPAEPNCGNIDADPRFADAPSGDLHLRICSPGIDGGDPDETVIPQDILDIDHDGNNLERTPDLDMTDRLLDGPDADATAVADMGCYEFVVPPCPWDCQAGGGGPDGNVGINDFLELLAQWHQPCTTCDLGIGEPGPGIEEMLDMLAHWNACPGPPQESIEEVVADAGLTMDQWNEFVDVMTDPEQPQVVKDNYRCWMDHYLDCHRSPWCPECMPCLMCPDADPFLGH